jgi:exopolyphosphatase/guanosine-5'-triphosphate,3'-diphosphate pyrophosphatase
VAVVDIGGGSMEVVFAAGGVVHQVHSLPIGTVKLTEACCRGDPVTRKSWKHLRKTIDSAIEEHIETPPFVPDMIVGSGGTFTALAQIVRAERDDQEGSVQGYTVSLADAVRLRDRLRETKVADRRHIPGLNPRRADIILAGVAAIVRLAKKLGTRRIVVNERGIRDGILLTMMENGGKRADRTLPPTGQDRIHHVRAFARTCRSNERHCDQVARLALQIFDGLQPLFALPPAGREILRAASLLHEVGYLIHHSGHHKHAYHLIIHSGLPSYTAHELELIANVARYHRRALPKKSHEGFAQLRGADRRLVRQLSAILRIADGLDRTHSQAVSSVESRLWRGRVEMKLLARRPCPVDVLDAERKSDLFVKVFGAGVILRPTKKARRRPHRWSFLVAGEATSRAARPASLSRHRAIAPGSRCKTPLRPSPRAPRLARATPAVAPAFRAHRPRLRQG